MTAPEISAKERWTRRIMGATGARPIGHAAPDEEGPQVPVTTPPIPPMPATPPTPPSTSTTQRITEWWRQGRPDIGAPAPAKDDDGDSDGDEQDVDDGDTVEDEPEEGKPTAGGPVEKVATDSRGRATRRKTHVRGKTEAAVGDRRMRVVAFNLSAAGVGYSFGLVQMIRAYMPVAEQGAVGVFGLVLAAGGAWIAWRATGIAAVRAVFQDKTLLLRIGVTAGAAGIGHEVGPVPPAYLNEYGQQWGLGPSAISLLVTAVGICGLLWWFIDRRLRPAHWIVRWLFRIPLASALIACVPYGSTPVV